MAQFERGIFGNVTGFDVWKGSAIFRDHSHVLLMHQAQLLALYKGTRRRADSSLQTLTERHLAFLNPFPRQGLEVWLPFDQTKERLAEISGA